MRVCFFPKRIRHERRSILSGHQSAKILLLQKSSRHRIFLSSVLKMAPKKKLAKKRPPKINSCHPLEWFSIVQLRVNSEIFKLSFNLSRSLVRAQTAFYELKGGLSLVMLKELFHDSLKICKFTRCVENHSSVIEWQNKVPSHPHVVYFHFFSAGNFCYQSYFAFCMLRSDGSCTGGKLINNCLT